MKRMTIIAWCSAALLAGIGATCEGGDDPGGKDNAVPAPKDDRPGCPGIDFRAPEERCFTIQTFVESRLGPYDVYIKIEGGNGAYPPHVPIASGGWKHGVVYRSGVKMKIVVTIAYEGEKSKEGFCSITDGQAYTRGDLKSITAGGGSPYQATCLLPSTTQ